MTSAVPIPGRAPTPGLGGSNSNAGSPSVGDSLLRKALGTSASGSPSAGPIPIASYGASPRSGLAPGSVGSIGSPGHAPRNSVSPLATSGGRSLQTSVLSQTPKPQGAPSPAVFLHMQRRQLLRKMCTLILTYHRRHEYGIPVTVAMHRDYPKAISSARSLLSHLSPLEAAGAIKRSVPRCECRSEECDDEPGSVEGITLIMHALGFLEQPAKKAAPPRPPKPAPTRSFETGSVDSGVDLSADSEPMMPQSGLIPNSGGPMVLPNTVDGEVSDIRLISELGAEGRVRMGRFQAEYLEWKRLSVRLVTQRAESMKGQTGITSSNKTFPTSWKADYKRFKKMPAKNFDLLRLRQMTTAGPSHLRNVWGADSTNPIYLTPQSSIRRSEWISITLESDSRKFLRVDLEELRRSSSPWALSSLPTQEAVPSSIYMLLVQRSEQVFGVPIARMKLKRGATTLFSKAQYADDDTQFRDGDSLVCVEAKLTKGHGSTSSLSRLGSASLSATVPARSSGLGDRISSSPNMLTISPTSSGGPLKGISPDGTLASPPSAGMAAAPGAPSAGLPVPGAQARAIIGAQVARPGSPQLRGDNASLSKSPKGSLLGSLISRLSSSNK